MMILARLLSLLSCERGSVHPWFNEEDYVLHIKYTDELKATDNF